jgi:hypothetical protein
LDDFPNGMKLSIWVEGSFPAVGFASPHLAQLLELAFFEWSLVRLLASMFDR